MPDHAIRAKSTQLSSYSPVEFQNGIVTGAMIGRQSEGSCPSTVTSTTCGAFSRWPILPLVNLCIEGPLRKSDPEARVSNGCTPRQYGTSSPVGRGHLASFGMQLQNVFSPARSVQLWLQRAILKSWWHLCEHTSASSSSQ